MDERFGKNVHMFGKHYGRNIEKMGGKAAIMGDGSERLQSNRKEV